MVGNKTEAELILEQMSGQQQLFPEVSQAELERILYYLEHYVLMKKRIEDYDQNEPELALAAMEGENARRISSDEYYANKTANAVILIEKRKWVYLEYKWMTKQIDRAYHLIIDRVPETQEEERKSFRLRYLEGHSRSNVYKYFGISISNRTIDRRLNCAIIKAANNMKCNGVLERDWKF